MIQEAPILGMPEGRERLIRGRRFLITAGTTGLGFQIARALYNLGGEVILGTRVEEHFSEAKAGLGEAGVDPFIADLTDPSQVASAVQLLRRQNTLPTDVIHSAAGGLEPIRVTLAKRLIKLQRLEEGAKAELLPGIKSEIAGRVDEAMGFAMAVNFEGPRGFLEEMKALLPTGAWFIDFSSLPSSVNPNWAQFYRGVATSKHAFEKEIEKQTPSLVDRGIFPAIVSGNVIADSVMGEIIAKLIMPLLPEEERQVWLSTFITNEDMARVALALLQTDPTSLSREAFPVRRFVVTPTEITDHLSPDHPVFQHQMPI